MKPDSRPARPGSRGGNAPAAAGFLLLLLLGGCGGNEGTPVPNVPPETEITGSVPSEGDSVSYHVTMFYRGSDVDGTTRRYEYLVETYPPTVTAYDQIDVQEPAADDPRWTATPLASADLVLLSDVLRGDPSANRFERWHTFFVRAVDNEGTADPSPDRRTFNTFNIGPKVWLLAPVVAGQPVDLPRTFVMRWDGLDHILGENTQQDVQDPREARWGLGPAGSDTTVANVVWSDWFAWDAPDSTGRKAVVRDVLAQFPADSTFVFAVQARDDGGAETPVFHTGPAKENNLAVLRVHAGLAAAPTLPVQETQANLGSWSFAGQGTQVVSAAGVDSVRMVWGPMQTAQYGGEPGEYRYGWNIADPGDDTQWSSWGQVRIAPPHELANFNEDFRVQARDDLGQVTSAVLRFVQARR
jgi:hypothetical protein